MKQTQINYNERFQKILQQSYVDPQEKIEYPPIAISKGTTGGLEGNSPKEDSMGNINVPGGKAAKSMKAQPKGHGAEKKSAGETADNKKSTIGS